MLIDTHTHLDNYENETDLDAALREIEQHRIYSISNSMDPRSYQHNLAIASRCDLVLPTFGIHPWNSPTYADRLDGLKGMIDQSPMIGEIGLDHYWVKDATQYPAQMKVFEFLIAAASQQQKTVNLHTKGAEKEILDVLRRYQVRRAIIHWYSGPTDILLDMVDYGCYFTIGVEVLRAETIQDIAHKLPVERLLTETDNPGGLKWLMAPPECQRLSKWWWQNWPSCGRPLSPA
ncbi:MAG: TatD family hydrolase [Dehalococcoidales bacterium]|nr:TatD family hydrolase [Dehalococcoidales bacterium]